MNLENLRKEIDEIDLQIASLFEQRMQTAANIAACKRQGGLPVLNASREQKVLENVSGQVSEQYRAYTKMLFSSMMDLSRAYQSGILGKKLQMESENELSDNSQTLVGCPGVEGSYSHQAYLSLFKKARVRFLDRFSDVIAALKANEITYGILPFENSTAGSVTEVLDLIGANECYIVQSKTLPILHKLLANPGASLAGIKHVFSHEQALAQCGRFMAEHPEFTAHHEVNTSIAAREVARSGDLSFAAIGSEECARIFGLQVIASDFQNNMSNETKFICVGKRPLILPDNQEICISVELAHEPGSLARLLTRFYVLGVNLTSIESRPIPQENFHFRFYLNLSGNIFEPHLENLLCALQEELAYFRFLGNYRC